MGFADQQQQQKFPFPFDRVYEAVLLVVSRNVNFKFRSEDKVLGRITASARASMFSWGENLSIQVEKIDEESTMVSMNSSLKVGMNVAGAGRHHKNFEEIVKYTSQYLQTGKL